MHFGLMTMNFKFHRTFIKIVVLTTLGLTTLSQNVIAAPTTNTPLPVIVDTDMGFDDWMAILYLLNNRAIDIKAISVDCAGETYCPAGAINVTRLIEISKKSQIPVFYGNEPDSTLTHQYPTLIRYSATAMDVTGFNKIKGVPFYTNNAAAHLKNLIIDAGKKNTPLTLLSIGSSTNLAAAIALTTAEERVDFKNGIKRIFKGGSAVGKAVNGKLSNQEIKGNINIPGIIKSDNTTAEWNIYPNARAAEALITSGLPITLIPINLSDQVPITEASFNMLNSMAKTDQARFVIEVISSIIKLEGGWGEAELDYWDPSVVVAAINPSLVTEKYTDVELCVDVSDNQYHGTTYINTKDDESNTNGQKKCEALGLKSGKVDVYTSLSTKGFQKEFFSALAK
jgi:pyrimidine-specific ribonucleoside hydrolase